MMNRSIVKVLPFLAVCFFWACSSSQKIQDPITFTSQTCEYHMRKIRDAATVDQLNAVSDLFARSCFQEVISLGDSLRRYHYDKFYSLSSEAAEIFTPEGTFTAYVLEDYERGFLTVLISLSYLHLQNEQAALVELRKSHEDKIALLYNFGDDPILNALLAALWDRFDTSISRPYWKKVFEQNEDNESLKKFSENRIKQIDADPNRTLKWSLAGYGYLPELEWQIRFFDHETGPYAVRSKSKFPETCSDSEKVLISTEAWIEKMSSRYKPSYHPLLYTKSLLRVPFGLSYGLLGLTAGTAVGLGGCGAAVYTQQAAQELCEMSLEAAGHIIKKSGHLVEYTLGPDLRHWQKMPKLIAISLLPQGLAPTCGQKKFDLLRTFELVSADRNLN